MLIKELLLEPQPNPYSDCWVYTCPPLCAVKPRLEDTLLCALKPQHVHDPHYGFKSNPIEIRKVSVCKAEVRENVILKVLSPASHQPP